jgi:leucine dehydrogenase
MELLDYMRKQGHEQVAYWQDERSGLKAIIALHDTTLGPALGGTRMWPYPSEHEALVDVLRLSKAMTFKASLAGLELGGGKAVIIGDPASDKSEALFRSFGEFIASLSGRYITAEDVGTTIEDMAIIRQVTKYATGLPASQGGSGDPSPVTALGVYKSIKAICKIMMGTESLRGLTVAIQGAGKVGYALAEHLSHEGVRIIVAEVNPQAATKIQRDFEVELVGPDQIYGVNCDIFSPCALGAVINDQTIPQLKCRIVAGSANNQLAEERHGEVLRQRGILYAPDYVINAGGLISVASEVAGYSAAEVWARAAAIYDTILQVLTLAKDEDIPPHLAAHRLAWERIERRKVSASEAMPAI